MWLFGFAIVLQILVVLELALNRIIAVVSNSSRNSVRKLADGNFFASSCTVVVSVFTIPASILVASIQLLLNYLTFWLALLIIIGTLAVLSETSNTLIATYVTTYNSGAGQILYNFVTSWYELTAPLFRVLLPIYNAIVYVLLLFWLDVILPMIYTNVNIFPDLIVNLTVYFGTLVACISEWLGHISTCTSNVPQMDNSTSPFWINDLSCVGNANFLTLDLMSPALYALRSASTLQTILKTSCAPISNVILFATYPMLDINLYKAAHGLINAFLHGMIGLPMTTINRCTYAKNTRDYNYTALEKTVMCTPDVTYLTTLVVSGVRALGTLIDNWLDFLVVVLEKSFLDVTRTCAPTLISYVWQNASEIFATSEMNVVGLTPSMYAITDGDSVVYHSMIGANVQTAYALHGWPFKIDASFGISAVRHSGVSDTDEEGDQRTGMLGCRCVDTESGIELLCASIPFRNHIADTEEEHSQYTVHRVRFMPDWARADLTCGQVGVRVVPLRFSRRRFSRPLSNGVDAGFQDAFNTQNQYGTRQAIDYTADAAIVVTPKCPIEAVARCALEIENCFPFCMGLHAAGQRSQNISLMNAQQWDEWTSIGQTDCAVGGLQARECDSFAETTRLLLNADFGVEATGCAATACVPDSSTNTFIRNSEQQLVNRSLAAWLQQEPWGFVRSQRQPFASAGDIFLYENPTTDVSGEIVVTRLYDNKRGDFTLQQEKLSLVSNSVTVQYYQCRDEQCYVQQLRKNNVVLPGGFFIRDSPTLAASSEWGVHWTATPSSGLCAAILDFCAETAGDSLTLEMHRPRLWTMRTVRHTDGLGRAFTDETLTAYMLIPDWFSCTKADFREKSQCSRFYGMKVVGLEYMNAENLLLTVLAAKPSDWDWAAEQVRDKKPFEYRFYFVHPNRHDCTGDDGGVEVMYTCWRRAEEGMFVAESMITETGAICPMLQRMPKWGSMTTEVFAAQVYLLKAVFEAVFIIPFFVIGTVNEIFEQRQHPTFHALTDGSGGSLFDLEDSLRAMDMSAFHAANTIARVATVMRNLGSSELESALIGTARIYQYTSAISSVEKAVLGGGFEAVSGPYQRYMWSMSSGMTESAPAQAPGVPDDFASRANNRWIRMFQTMVGSLVSWSKVSIRLMKRIVLRITRRGSIVRVVGTPVAVRDVVSTIIVSVHESQGEISRGLFDNMRTVCDASGQVLGRTNAWGQSVRHSCMIIPDTMEGLLRAILIFTVDYPMMSCVCKNTVGFPLEQVLNDICLPAILPMAAKAYVIQRIQEKSTSNCFSVMDSTNTKLQTVFDPLFSRMVKAQEAVESAFGLFVTQILGLDLLDTKCLEFESPYIVSILPEPVDYFMGCMETFDCRTRCFDTFKAFNDSLLAYTADSVVPPSLILKSDIETESRYFSDSDMELGKHLAPFAVYAVILLEDAVCRKTCGLGHAALSRCVAVGGVKNGVLNTQYYCIPASLIMSVYEGVQPKPTQNATNQYNDELLSPLVTVDVKFATVHMTTYGRPEWLVVLARDQTYEQFSVWVMPSDLPDVALQVLETKAYNRNTESRTEDIQDNWWNLQTIKYVRVLPAHTTRRWATIFVVGTKRRIDSQFSDLICLYMHIDTSYEGSIADATKEYCVSGPSTVYSTTHETVCLDTNCSEVVRVPIDGAEEVLFEKLEGYKAPDELGRELFDWSVKSGSTRRFTVPETDRNVMDIDSVAALTMNQDLTVQLTRRTLSLFGSVISVRTNGTELKIDVPITGRASTQQAWLQNVRLKMDSGVAQSRVNPSFTVTQKQEIQVKCAITSCTGCHGFGPLHIDLQNKCFAAASCGISKCVGTRVNMKRPLCQIASLVGVQIDFMRVLLESFWDFFSRTVILIVELSENRRKQYEYLAPEDAMMSMVCNAKDGIVETNALFGSLYAQVKDSQIDAPTMERASLTSTLAYTERTMTSVAIVQFLSQLFMGVLYPPIVLWRGMECQLNDIFLIVVGLAKAATPSVTSDVTFKIGNSKLDKFEENVVAMCLTDKMKQDLNDVSDPNTEKSMTVALNDVYTGISDLTITYEYGVLIFGLDALFSWLIGVVKGVMNLEQVMDLSSCKFPSFENNKVGSCVCGDNPGRIPKEQRESKTTDSLWCRGLLLMNDIDGMDLLVWNPYSLEQLLKRNNAQDYFLCLKNRRNECSILKPVDPTFETQGIDVLQVISRCRTNYQQKKWDEGTLMIGLIEYEEWQSVNVKEAAIRQLYRSSRDLFQTHRLRFAQLSSIMDGFTNLDFQTWSCLKTALYANDWQNNCMEVAIANGIFANSNSPLTYFEYELLQDQSGKLLQDATTFENLDACETFSGKMKSRNSKGVMYPKMAWDGNSQNAVPVAEMHNKIQDNDQIRILEAQNALDELIKNKINPAFERLTLETLDKIQTEFWSFEGDFIHQLVDCVILGPYAAADMVPSLSLSSGRISVPQYNRGSASSREMQYDLRTQGSPSRKKLMKAVIDQLSDTSDRRIQTKALSIIQKLKEVYTVKSNLYCTCLNQPEPSLECCLSNKQTHATLAGFARTFSASSRAKQLMNFTEEFNSELMDEAIEYDVLRNIWYDQDTVADWTVSETDRVEMANMYAFDYSEPVREYSLNEVPKTINKTLWRTCMESLDGVFFTMPLRVESDGGLRVDAETIFDPLEVTDADATKYMHGMERAIERILEKAKLLAPTYWSHVHRYMPSDSVWCEENAMRRVPPKRRATHPAQWNGMNFTRGAFASPDADEVLYVGRLGSACVCGWGYTNSTCFVPVALCATVQSRSERWEQICRAGSYSTPSDAIVVRRVLFANGSYPLGCEEMQPSTVWGMLDTAQQMDWYDGSSVTWNVSLHEIAAHGPAGVRLGMLVTDSPLASMPAAPQPDLTSAFNEQFQHTIAQPVCQSTRHRLFVEDLTQHFRDVLFPMAHAVHAPPSQVICGRWVIEYALFVAMEKISGLAASDVLEQRGVEERWRTRCKYQLEIVGMCTLRDVYSFVPRDRQSLGHCNFTMAPAACVKFFVTDSCLLMCDGKLYDPCMCGADQCKTVFSKDTCTAGYRSVLSSPELQMSSLHWPQTVWPANPSNQAKLDATLAALKQNTERVTFEDGFFDYVRRQASYDDGETPDAFCDDLIDYMDPSAQHPVGYHPTCACDRRETNMRGFDTWMSSSKDSQHAYSIDPVRLRNMSMYSTTFGAAHLTCDAIAYMSQGARLNSLHMQSKWNPKARADASMPVLPDFSSEEGMASFGTPSYDQHDTPLQTDEYANDLFRHSVGLIRDWLRDYDNVSEQSVLDELWPHWVDTGITDTFAAPSTAELAGKCQLPPLLRCFQDSDCIVADAQLRCRKNQNGPDSSQMGICIRVDTCYQHTHCPDDKLCSGTGFCEIPEIVIYNSIGEDISAQIFASDSKKCPLSSFGVSAFQNAPTFARDNGLCGVHELFNYRNATEIAEVSQIHPYIKSVRSRMTQRIPDPVTIFKSMTDLNNEDTYNILKMLAHPCDRDYEHSDFGICTPESFETFIESDASVSKSRSTRTWKKKNEATYLEFCNLQVGGGLFGALTSPYIRYDENSQPVDTLKHTKTTIKKCDDYKFCPSTVYTVRGKKVDRFVFDVEDGQRQSLRLYRTYDAQMCMSFGVWDFSKKRCYVDHFIVPIFSVLFTDANVEENGNDKLQTQQIHFQTLQTECPDAFGKESSTAFRAFQNTYVRLTSPYEPWNENEKYDAAACESQNGASTHNSLCVMQTINKLTLRIFNVDTNYVGGIDDMDTYKKQGRCTTYIYRKLQKVREKNRATFEGGNTIIPVDHIPGSTLYMFSGHFPVEVPLLWIWKCVLIASEQDGGAPQNWFTAITDAEETYELQCPNIEAQSSKYSTLLRHLQLQPDIYESKTESNVDTDVYKEMLKILITAVDFWSVMPVPIVQCRKLNTTNPSICDVEQYEYNDFQCWNRVIMSNVQDLSEQKKTVMPCEDSDSKCTIYDVALKIIFGKNRKELEDMNSITINWLKQEGLVRELTLAYEFTSNFNYKDTIPELELTNLQFLNESVIYNTNADAYSTTSPQQVTCPTGTFALSSPEYEISQAIHNCALRQTSELCFYTKIFNIHEVYSALVGDNLRISNEISLGYDIQGRTSTVAISQKQMLLLMLYFLREVMYLGSSSAFGTMRYNTDARRFMLADLDIAKKLASRLEDSKTYNHALKKNNFYCPEEKLIADVNPSELQFQLRRCLEDLKLDTGWTIPAGKKVILHADRDMFLNSFYVSFLVKDTQTQFLDELIMTDWHDLQYSHRTRRLCFDTPEGAAHLFPLWSGELDMQSCPHGDSCGCQMSSEGFDTFLDLTCDNSQSMDSCAGNFPLFYDNVKRAMYDNCWSEQGRVVSVSQYEQMKSGNLCSREPQSETCSVAFGSQGRVQGRAAADLHKFYAINSTQAGLFNPDNTLFRAESTADPTQVTALQLLRSDIGGHSMAFTVKEIGSFRLKSVVMDLTCVSAGVSCKAAHPTNWLRNIRSAWSVQHNLYVHNNNLNRDSENGEENAPWHCPLQWLSAYSDSTAKYAARSPSAERNRIRFGHITGAKTYAHTTVVRTIFATQHPARFMSDNSACVDGVLDFDSTMRFDCSGKQYLLSALLMHNGKWSPANFVNQKVAICTKLLDWPHYHYGTVDGNKSKATDVPRYCNVFWRLPSFALRYAKRIDTDVDKYGWKPNDKDGVCHMGRLRKSTLQETDINQFCTATDSRLRCRMLQRNASMTSASKYSWYERNFNFEAPFKATKRPALRNRKCSRCDRHDTASIVDRRHRETALHNRINHLSVGKPVVVSTERLIAATLRRHACPNAHNKSCLRMHDAINSSSWTRTRFLSALLETAKEYQHRNDVVASDDELWSIPWVLCEKKLASDTPAQSKVSCKGSISKQEWRNVATRFSACRRESTPLISEKKSILNLCLLSEQTGELCRNISDWNAAIMNILCTVGKHPDCTSRAFYYNPSQYSLSNKDFVYNSIQNFYTKVDGISCPREDYVPGIPNSDLLESCRSYALVPLLEMLKIFREFVHTLSMLLYYALQFLMNLLAVFFVSITRASVVSEQLDFFLDFFSDNLRLYTGLLLDKLKTALELISPILYGLTDFGPFHFLRGIVEGLCLMVRWTIVPIVKDFILPMIIFFEDFATEVARALCKIGINAQCFDTIPKSNARIQLENFDIPCVYFAKTNKSNYKAILPMPTRCWSTYNTFYGDSSMLSCRASDTCYKSITDTTLVKCSMCEAPFQDYEMFGCSEVTQTCTCNLPTFSEQECISNEECFGSDSVCRFLDGELEPSVGFTRCETCQTKRFCMLTSGRSTGYCACGLLNVEFARCAQRGEAVIPGYNQLCIYTQDYNYLKTTEYIFSFYTTMSVPCVVLNPAFTSCAMEGNDNELYIVGTQGVRRRHLLAEIESGAEMTAQDTHNSLCQDALSSEHMPAYKHLCIEAFHASTQTLRELGLQSTLPPCSFCSKEDVMQTFLLHPNNLFVVATNISRVLHIVSRHTMVSGVLKSFHQVRKDVNIVIDIMKMERILVAEDINGYFQVRAVNDDERAKLVANIVNFILTFIPQRSNATHTHTHTNRGNGTGRKLLSIDDVAQSIERNFEMSAELRRAFEAQLTSAFDFSFETPIQKVAWPNTWPPKVGLETLQGNSCPPLTNMLRNTEVAFKHIGISYSKQNQMTPVSSIEESWITVERRSDVNITWADYDALLVSEGVITGTVLWFVDYVMSLVQASPNFVFDVSASAIQESLKAVQCDFESVQTCSKWRVNFSSAFIVVCIYYFVLYLLFGAVGLSLPVVAASFLIIPFVFYVSYGYAPLCFPTIPVCLYDDILSSLQVFTPKNIKLPDVWYKSETCVSYTTLDKITPCLRKCSDAPFSYLEWYDPLSWWAIEFKFQSWLLQAVKDSFVSALLSEESKYDIQTALDFRRQVVDTQNSDLIYTNRICAILTTYKLLPYLMLIGVFVLIVLGTVQALFVVINAIANSIFLLLLSAFY
jgi:hypothetical protein